MKTAAYHLVRVGLAITFLWIGILIFRDPQAWGSYLQPWAAQLLPIPIREAMIGTAALDSLIGFLLLIDAVTWLAAGLGAIHLAIVLTVAGINVVTVRDIGLLAAALALMVTAWPNQLAFGKKTRRNE